MIIGIAGKMRDSDDGDWPVTASSEQFTAFCESLGERVGRYGHRLVVRSRKKDTAGRNVVNG